MNSRWSDPELEQFHAEFIAMSKKFDTHLEDEAYEQGQQQELYRAVFQQEDKTKNIPPGLLQMVGQISAQVEAMSKAHEKHITFVGGVLFTITTLWFFATDVGPRILSWFKS